jgi:hypothetical protein
MLNPTSLLADALGRNLSEIEHNRRHMGPQPGPDQPQG